MVGEAQRKASEPVKQDIRQGTYYLTKTNYLTETNEPRSRPSRFNVWDNATVKIARSSLVDVSLIDSSSFDGLGYKFGVGAAIVARPHNKASEHIFKTYVEQKQPFPLSNQIP